MTTTLSALAGWALLVGLTGALGAIGSRWLVLPRATRLSAEGGSAAAPDAAATTRLLNRAGTLFSTLLLLAMAGVLARQLQEFRDPFVPWSEDLSLLVFSTPWGSAWQFGVLGAMAAVVGFALSGLFRTEGWVVATVGAAIASVFPARTGHANAVEGLRGLALAADTLHVLGAGMWLGGLVVVLLLMRQWKAAGHPVAPLVLAFSPLARIGVFTMVATGVFAAWIHLPDVLSLVTTAYGRTLVLKVLLALAALALGWRNWKRITPRLDTSEGDRELFRYGSIEVALAQAVLLVTAFLVRLSPTGGP